MMAPSRAARTACLALALGACSATQTAPHTAQGATADADAVLDRAEAEHSLVRLTTVDGDTLIGRVSSRGGEIRVSGTRHRVNTSDLTSIARGTPLQPERGREFRVGGALVIVALVAPLAAFVAAYGEDRVGLVLLAAAAVAGGALGAAAAEADDPGLGPIEWTTVWEAE